MRAASVRREIEYDVCEAVNLLSDLAFKDAKPGIYFCISWILLLRTAPGRVCLSEMLILG